MTELAAISGRSSGVDRSRQTLAGSRRRDRGLLEAGRALVEPGRSHDHRRANRTDGVSGEANFRTIRD